MTRRRALRAAVALLAALLIAGAYVTPAASAAGLRAMKCCAEHCAKPRSAAAASHCCPSLGATADGMSLLPSAKAELAPALATLTLALPPIALVAPGLSASSSTSASPRAAPLFLRTLSLRL